MNHKYKNYQKNSRQPKIVKKPIKIQKNDKFYTDYPFEKTAEIKLVTLLSYDGNKYCEILFNNQLYEVKLGYLFKNKADVGKWDNAVRHNFLKNIGY